jgi:hypothetical protein
MNSKFGSEERKLVEDYIASRVGRILAEYDHVIEFLESLPTDIDDLLG